MSAGYLDYVDWGRSCIRPNGSRYMLVLICRIFSKWGKNTCCVFFAFMSPSGLQRRGEAMAGVNARYNYYFYLHQRFYYMCMTYRVLIGIYHVCTSR